MILRKSKKLEIYNAIKNHNFELLKTLTDSLPAIGGIEFTIKEDTFENRYLPNYGLSILHIAAFFNFLECFQYIQTKHSLSLRHTSADNYFPLHYACLKGSSEVVLYILNQDPEEATIYPEDTENYPYLYLASFSKKCDIIKELIRKGSKIDFTKFSAEKFFENIMRFTDQETTDLFEKEYPDQKQFIVNPPAVILDFLNGNLANVENDYRGVEDIKFAYISNSTYNTLISIIVSHDSKRHHYKTFLLRILKDAIDNDICIEPPNLPNQLQDGVCHWACQYYDLDVAKAMLQTKDVIINRFNNSYKTGAAVLAIKRRETATKILQLLIEKGLDVNIRYNDRHPSILQTFITSITLNYDEIELLIKFGADIHAPLTRFNDGNRQPISLYKFVMSKNDEKLKEIFNDVE